MGKQTSSMIRQGCVGLLAVVTMGTTSAALAASDQVGTIYHYERTNQDGSLPEQVSVFYAAADAVEVYKAREKCTDAAFVHAKLDPESGVAASITGARLLPDAQHRDFAFLTYDEAAKELSIRVELPNMPVIEKSTQVEHTPWHLYDFDFASLTIAHQAANNPKADFEFGLPLLLADPSLDEPLTYLGTVKASYDDKYTALSHRFSLSFVGDDAEIGQLIFNSMHGHLELAELNMPNHLGYEDFKLDLLSTQKGGEKGWTNFLTNHFAGC
ncbi:hypothetical protein [Maritalea myrionectae]|uniref:hypothetical protein n=1 Tax=Maritalea myrionectae TaxID=454601 RepID=UPI00055C478C|nr:hypothetical protein [Maritalea myrionectae]